MRSLFVIFLFLFLLSRSLSAQQLLRIDYKHYTSWFSFQEKIPVLVEYTLTAAQLACSTKTKRPTRFTADPAHHIPDLNRDYKRSGYDRGHNMSAADNCCDSAGMKECFYFSNMTPQPHAFNAGKWEELEDMERAEARRYGRIIVTCGSLGKGAAIGEDSVAVPQYMWKVIYLPTHRSYSCYLFPNTSGVNKDLAHYLVKLNDIEEKARVCFTSGTITLNNQ